MSKRSAYSAYAPAAKAPRAELNSTMEAVHRYERRGLLDAGRLDDAVLADLHCLGPAGVVRALDQFCKHDLEGVDNHAGLLKDIIIAESEALMNEGPPESTPSQSNGRGRAEAGTSDATAISSLLRDYHTAGSLDMDKFDTPVRRDLESLPYGHAVQVLQIYVESDRGTVTNHSSFLKSIIKLARTDPEFGQRGAQLDPAVQDKLDEAIAGGYIAPSECDALLRASLGVLAPRDALNVLTMFIDIVSSGQETIHNRPAFLAGMLKRYRQAGTDAAGRPTKSVPEVLDEYCGSGRVPRDVVEPLLRDLEMLPPGGAAQVLEEFVRADHASIRNPTGYLKGMIRKIFGVPGWTAPAPSRPPPAAAAAAYRPARPDADASVLNVLAGYRDAGMIADGELDHGCVTELQRLGVARAEQVLADFFQHDIHSLHNKSSYLMGIIKRSGVKDTYVPHHGGKGDYPPRRDGGKGDYPPPRGGGKGDYPPRRDGGKGDYPPPRGGGKGDYPPRRDLGKGDYPPRRDGGKGDYPPRRDAPPAEPRYNDRYEDRAPPPPYSQQSSSYGRSSSYAEPATGRAKGYGKGTGKGYGKGGGKGYQGGYEPEPISVRPKPAVRPAEAEVFCPSCGVKQPPVNFCVKCGFSLNKFVEGVLGRQ
eukprot:EG_transcript_5399